MGIPGIDPITITIHNEDGTDDVILVDNEIKPDWKDPKFKLVLDVDADLRTEITNDQLPDGTPDGVANYLPGYEGSVAKLHKGAAYDAVFSSQRMNVVLEGIGTDLAKQAGVARIEFTVVSTKIAGYTGNKTDIQITGEFKDKDYSFRPTENYNFTEDSSLVKMEKDRTWIALYAKDYGGSARVYAVLFDANGNELHKYTLDIPLDTDRDGIADKWENQQADAWKQLPGHANLFGYTPLQWIGRDEDDEPRFNGEQPPPPNNVSGGGNGILQGTAGRGDGLHTFYEYRGVLLDGGGHDPNGQNPHPGGHKRLSTLQREILIDVDVGKEAAAMVDQGQRVGDRANLRNWMDDVSRVFSQANNGAGMYAYYVIGNTNYNAQLIYLNPNARTSLAALLTEMRRYVEPLRAPATGVPVHWNFRHLMIERNPGDTSTFLRNEAIGGFVSGLSNIGPSPYDQKSGSFLFVEHANQMRLNVLRGLLTDPEFNVATLRRVATGVIIHELAHQLDTTEGHYSDADGSGGEEMGTNTANDFRTIQFNYTQRPLPQGYRYQDYWLDPFQFGQGLNSGFIRNYYLGWDSWLDVQTGEPWGEMSNGPTNFLADS